MAVAEQQGQRPTGRAQAAQSLPHDLTAFEDVLQLGHRHGLIKREADEVACLVGLRREVDDVAVDDLRL